MPRQRSEVTVEAAEQLEAGSLLQDLVDVARPRGHTWDSACLEGPQTLAFQTFAVIHEELRGDVKAPSELLHSSNANVMKYFIMMNCACLQAFKVANI